MFFCWWWQKIEEGQSVREDPFQSCSNRNGGRRAFMPFSRYSSSSSSVPVATAGLGAATKEEKEESVMNRLSLQTPSVKEGCGSRGSRSSSNRAVSSSPPTVHPSLRASSLQQTARKQRRCWSPELHRRFVNALQKLGGSQGKKLIFYLFVVYSILVWNWILIYVYFTFLI